MTLIRYMTGLIILASGLLMAQSAPPSERKTPGKKSTVAEVKSLPNGNIQLGKLTLNRQEGCLSFPAKLHDPDTGALEVLISTPEGRIHETLLITDVLPIHLQTMLYLLGAKNGPRTKDKTGNQGDLVDIDLAWVDATGKKHREPIERWVVNNVTGKNMKRRGWVFTGSIATEKQLQADVEGNLVIVYSIGSTILDIPSREGEDDIFFSVDYKRAKKQPAPTFGGDVQVIVTPRPPPKVADPAN